VAAVLVGRIPEIDALIVAGAEEIGESFYRRQGGRETWVTEFSGLVRTATRATRAGTERKPAKLDLLRAKLDTVGGGLLYVARKELIGKRSGRLPRLCRSREIGAGRRIPGEGGGHRISRESVRKLMMRAGLWQAKPRKLREVHMWRPRRSCRGELAQWDTSVHAWLENRGPDKMYLVALIDDAMSTLFARFVSADSTDHHMRVLWSYVERYGRPQAVYTDKASLFQPTLAPRWQSEEPGPKNETQLGRALREMGIEWIAAHSPQAKGRIERSFSTLQDRLVKGLRVVGAAAIEEANRYLDEVFLPEWNERFTVEAESAIDAHRPIGDWLCLASILSHVETRQVQNDYTVAWAGRHWQIPRAALRVEARLDGTLQARAGDAFLQLKECERPVRTAQKPKHRPKRYVPRPGESRWMDGFSIQQRKFVTTVSRIDRRRFCLPAARPVAPAMRVRLTRRR